ncbi:nephrocystin-1-like isoform X2 [Tubulanus polymorphus]|uniref:nephrocystin-1-like isoform X2 n=1 Tax=Tubulanus polymorphus TaxID=672921 RepID=UPI003DA26ACB
MPKKVSSPLQSSQKEVDSLKKKIDDFIKECEKKKYADEKDKNSNKFKKVVKRGDDLVTECERLHLKVENLDSENEAKEISDFDDQKKSLEQSVLEIKKSLSRTLRFIQTGEEEEEEDDDDDNDEDVEEEEEDDVEEEEEDVEEEESEDEEAEKSDAPKKDMEKHAKDDVDGKHAKKKVEKDHLDGKQADVKVKKDDEEEVDEEEEEEEEEASEEEYEEEEGEEEEEEEEEEEAEEEEFSESMTMRQFEAIVDYVAQQPEDLGFEVGDILTILSTREDGWWEAINADGEKGMVPSTYLKEHNKYAAIQKEEEEPSESTGESTRKSGKMLWKGIKDAIKETSATDVLHALGAIPSGFRQSTLSILQKDDVYTMKNYLAPKLSISNVFYKDLFLNPSTNKIRARNVRVQRILQIQSCRQIPLPGSGVEISGRCIRVCLFDGKNVLSNIHVIRCQALDKEMKTWGCSLKVNDIMKCLDYGEFFIRTNSSEAELGILFEMSYQFVRKTGEQGEMSVGWVNLPLFEQNGAPMANKNYDLPINGGTIHEKGVEVDPDVGKTAGTNRLRTLMSSKKQPRLLVKAFMPNREQKDQLDMLPDVIVGSSIHIPFLSYYRQVLADELLRDRVDINSTEIIHNPMLVSFPTAAEQHDIMDAIRFAWIEKLKITRRQDKVQFGSRFHARVKEQEQLKDLFSQTYMESGYPLLNLNSLPNFILGNSNTEDLRFAEISKFTQIIRDKKTVLAALLSPDINYQPFDIKELSYEVAGQFCLIKH